MPEHFLINDNMVAAPAPAEDMDSVEILRGPNIKEFPITTALPESLSVKALLKVGDNITTDHIMPAGAQNPAVPFQHPLSVEFLLRRLRQGIPAALPR